MHRTGTEKRFVPISEFPVHPHSKDRSSASPVEDRMHCRGVAAALAADAHVASVVACALLDGTPPTAITADSDGRLMHHNITAYLSLLGACLLPSGYRVLRAYRAILSQCCMMWAEQVARVCVRIPSTFPFFLPVLRQHPLWQAGRLAKNAAPTCLLDGRSNGAVCSLQPLALPRALAAPRSLDPVSLLAPQVCQGRMCTLCSGLSEERASRLPTCVYFVSSISEGA